MRNRNKIQIIRMTAGCVLFAAGLLLVFIAKQNSEFAQWFTTHIYPWVSGVCIRLSEILPCSLSELLLYLLFIFLLISIIRLIMKIISKKEWRAFGIKKASSVFFLSGLLFFLFALNCGVNYYRLSFSETENIETQVYTVEGLKEVSIYLANEVNKESAFIKRAEEGGMTLPDNSGSMAQEAMQKLSADYTSLTGYYPKPKWLLLPEILSYQNITGIYSPFTVEANYNNDITDYNIPFTMCHELSHLRGFMQEQEANFIAYLACTASDDEAFRYSGNLLAFIYCSNVLRNEDTEAYREVRDILNEEVEADLHENNEFWARYDGRIAEVSGFVNDTYLKANGQSEGVKSYDRMVDLVVSYYFQTINKM